MDDALRALAGVWRPQKPAPGAAAVRTILPGVDTVFMHQRWRQEAAGKHSVYQWGLCPGLDGQPVELQAQAGTTGSVHAIDRGVCLRLSQAGRVMVEIDHVLDPATQTLHIEERGRQPDGSWQSAQARWVRTRVKQVLLYRRDLKMRKGKIAAQCAHASIAVFTRHDTGPSDRLEVPLDGPMAWWTRRSMAKIVLSVDDLSTLEAAHKAAQVRGLPTSIITDAGRTEFKGVPTRTALAIGPAEVGEIDEITGPAGLVQAKLA